MLEVIDKVPDVDGDVIEVGFDTIEELPYVRMRSGMVVLGPDQHERVMKALNEAGLRMERSRSLDAALAAGTRAEGGL